MKISVVIITNNRRGDLEISIPAFMRQTYRNFEIIVIDNASNDGTREMMAEKYPQIRYFRLPDNFDIRSINIGIDFSDGDIIWRTDCDSCPETPDEFQKVIDIFASHPEIDIIATAEVQVHNGGKIWDWYPLPHNTENVPDDGYKSNTFVGTGAAIRRRVFDKIGGFWGFGFEELDFSTRAIAAGFNIRYFPNVRVSHYVIPSVRDFSERWIVISRQYVRYNCKYFPFARTVGRLFIIFNAQILLAPFQKVSPAAFFEGIFEMNAAMIHTFRHERTPLPRNILDEVTLGTSLAKSQSKFFINTFRNKFKRILKRHSAPKSN